jgi:DNA primase
MIPAELVERARDADLAATAERLGVRLKWGKANERVGRCPACGGDDQLSVNVRKKTWRCSRCGKGGVAVDLVMHACNLAFRQAVEFLAEDAT